MRLCIGNHKITEGKCHHTIIWAGELTEPRDCTFLLVSMNAKQNPKEFWAHLQNECNINYYSFSKIRTVVTSLCFVDKSCFIHFSQKFANKLKVTRLIESV